MANEESESRSLQSILGSGSISVPSFFESIWQRSCATFSAEQARQQQQKQQQGTEIPSTIGEALLGSSCWSEERVKENPHGELIKQGWHVLVELLDQVRQEVEQNDEQDNDGDAGALLFKNQEGLSPDDRALYGNSLFAAFLDGCSIIVNHADFFSPWIAALCQDLQLSFPHAYANTYLTPAGCQAVSAHADDRDVLVIQIVGSKEWKVYEKIPIPYPYPHEQVGKSDLEVPDEVLQGPVLMKRIMRPGDVLYMPRGYVHEARALQSEPSFHVTIALATHDWTLAGLMSNATQKLLTTIVDYRMAVPRHVGMRDWMQVPVADKEGLQQHIQEAFELLQREITAKAIHDNLQHKYEQHNRRACSVRMKLIHEKRLPKQSTAAVLSSLPVVGREASRRVSLSTSIRVATDEEKASLPPTQQPRGLHVREETYDGIIFILQRLKGDTALQCRVKDLKSIIPSIDSAPNELICDLTLLCFARQCVELGAIAIVQN
jgi:ribosomal protein L16 Arg81 hydroxylase